LAPILEAVAGVYELGTADIIGRQRTKSIAEARMVVCLVARLCTRLSYPEIGEALGRRHHTTIMALCESAERQCERDTWLASAVAVLLEQFGAAERECVQ
jgi:chromosomal replication initiator protein